MEDKEGENDKKSPSQSQARSRSRSKVLSQNEVPKEEEEENAAEPRTDPSPKNTLSHNSNMVTSPSVVKTKSTSDKSKSNVPSPAKVSIKTTGENEQDREEGSEPGRKGSLLAGSQSVVAQPSTGGGGGPGAGGISVSGSRGTVLAGGGSRGTVLADGGSRGTVFADSSSKGTVIAAGGGGSGATVVPSDGGGGGGGGGRGGFFQGDNFLGVPCVPGFLQKRSPFIHDPPYPEERRARVQLPRSPIDYIINLREDLADFQESHGLPRTRDYSFVSLGLALAQETGRAILSVFQMFTELFPILAIVSLILRFALDKLIEILEATDTTTKLKKSIIFALQMLAIMIPLWILFGTIIIPLISLILSLFKRVLRIKGGTKKVVKARPKVKASSCSLR